MYTKKKDAVDKMDECREWNKNNPEDSTKAWLYTNSSIIDSVS